MTDEPVKWSPFLLRLASSAARALTKANDDMADHAQSLMDIGGEAGDPQIREAYDRLMACVMLGMIHFWRALPDEVIDKPGLSKAEARLFDKKGKSPVALMLETVDYAQHRSEAISEAPRAKRHGRR